MASTGDIVTLSDLTVSYGQRAAVHHLGGAIRRGSLTAVVGPNGSGKSSLVKAIAGVIRPASGRCSIASRTRIAYLAQRSELDTDFPASVRDVVSLGLWPRRGLLGRHRAQDRRQVDEALHEVGLDGFQRRRIDSLSGGQMQRALFARVIVQDADLILLDEPFNAVDETTVAHLMALVHGWIAAGKTVVAVVHDIDLVRAEFPQTLVMARRALAWGPTGEVLETSVRAAQSGFRQAWDDDAPICAPERAA